MNKIKTFFRRINFKLRHDYLAFENVVLVIAVILCVYWTCQSVVAMSRNWELSEKLTAEKKALELLSVEVEAAELENEYFASNEYQEIAARKFLDKKLPGENMVVLPDNSEKAKTKHEKGQGEQVEVVYPNFEKWMMYLFPKY